jgi:hypothetical protein
MQTKELAAGPKCVAAPYREAAIGVFRQLVSGIPQ